MPKHAATKASSRTDELSYRSSVLASSTSPLSSQLAKKSAALKSQKKTPFQKLLNTFGGNSSKHGEKPTQITVRSTSNPHARVYDESTVDSPNITPRAALLQPASIPPPHIDFQSLTTPIPLRYTRSNPNDRSTFGSSSDVERHGRAHEAPASLNSPKDSREQMFVPNTLFDSKRSHHDFIDYRNNPFRTAANHRSKGKQTFSSVGRSVADEYIDYNDELSKQLKMAAIQDQREYENRRERRIQFRLEHCSEIASNTASTSSSAAAAVATMRKDNRQFIRVASNHNHKNSPCSPYSPSRSSYSQSPEQASPTTLHNQKKQNDGPSLVGKTFVGGNNHTIPSSKRKGIETSTQSTVSFSSSSDSLRSQEEFNYSQWGHNFTNVGGTVSLNNNTSKSSSISKAIDVEKNYNDAFGWSQTEKEMRNQQTDRDAIESKKGKGFGSKDNVTMKREQRRLNEVSSPPLTLRPILEEKRLENDGFVADLLDTSGHDFPSSASFGMEFSENEDSENVEDAYDQFSSHEQNHSLLSRNKNVPAIDVVSHVSYHDDPSIDMMSSLATNDTSSIEMLRLNSNNTTNYHNKHFSWDKSNRSGNHARAVRSNVKRVAEMAQDPPGSLIDEILQDERAFRRDPSPLSPKQVDEENYPDKGHIHRYPIQEQNQRVHSFPHGRSRHDNMQNVTHHRHNDKPEVEASGTHKILEFSHLPKAVQISQQGWQRSYPSLSDTAEGKKDSGAFDIEFVNPSRNDIGDCEASSLGNLTAEGEDEPPSERGDDDTATKTMDTVDLVAEVKRVWRHVQKYEKKKQKKKDFFQQFHNDREVLDGVDEENAMTSTVLQNLSVPQAKQSIANHFKPANDENNSFDDANISNLTIFSRTDEANAPMSHGHIASTTKHEINPASPGSNFASHTSTEKDVEFVKDGVESFFQGQVHTNLHKPQQTHFSSARNVFMKAEQKLSEADNLKSNAELSQPYDMTKSRSTGTALSSKTQKTSNKTEMIPKKLHNNAEIHSGPSPSLTQSDNAPVNNNKETDKSPVNLPSKVRVEMARKYMKQHNLRNPQTKQSIPPTGNSATRTDESQHDKNYSHQHHLQQQLWEQKYHKINSLHHGAIQNASEQKHSYRLS